MRPSTLSVASASSQSWDWSGDGIRSDADANYRRMMLNSIAKGHENGWLK